MGFLKNLITFKKIDKIESGYSIGRYRRIDDKALLYDGEIVLPNILDVSINMRVPADNANKRIFFAKKTEGGCAVLNNKGEVLFASLNSAVRSKKIKKEVFVVDEEKKVEVVQYIMPTENGKVLMIPQVGYVSAECEEIGEMDNLGRRKIDELKLSSMGVAHPVRGVSYYINPLGSMVSPEILNEVEAGEYKICLIEDERGILLDYIYDKNFVQQSKGYPFIDYVNGRFFAKDINGRKYLIDEKGHKLHSGLHSYHVLKNGVLVGLHGLNAGKAVVLDKENKVIYNLDNVAVDETTGIVSGTENSGEEKFSYMFGLNRARTFLVNPIAAELMVKILKGDKLSANQVVEGLQSVSDEDLSQTIDCYEWIVKDNIRFDSNNETLKDLKGTAKNKFLNGLASYVQEFSEQANKQIKARKMQHIKQLEVFKRNEEEIEKE